MYWMGLVTGQLVERKRGLSVAEVLRFKTRAGQIRHSVVKAHHR